MFKLESADPEAIDRYHALLDRLDHLPDHEVHDALSERLCLRQRKLPRQSADKSRYHKLVLGVLEVGMEPVSRWWIIDAASSPSVRLQAQGHYVSTALLKLTLNQMEKDGEVRACQRPGSGHVKHYWVPCKHKVFAVGDRVVELKGTRSEQRGVIVRFQMHHSQGLCPVVRFENSSIRFSTEELLDPALHGKPSG